MLIKNSLRLLINNLTIVFKVMVCSLVVLLLSYLLMTSFFSDVVKKISGGEEFKKLIEKVNAVWTAFISGDFRPEIDFVVTFEAFMETVRVNFSSYSLPLLCLFIGFYLITVLSNLFVYTLTYMMNARMSTYEKKGFLASFIYTLKKSLPFEAWYSLLTLIVLLLSVFVTVLFVVYTFSKIYFLSIVIGLWLGIAVYSLYQSMTAMFRPLSVNDVKIKSLFKNRYSRSGFVQVFATFLFSIITFTSLNVMTFITTLGAGLLISIPVTQVFFVILRLVLLYSAEGKKYYLDYETIETPNKIKNDASRAEFLDDIEM